MNSKSKFTHTLGPVSAALINTLLQDGKFIFSIDDAIEITGKERKAAIDLLRRLDQRGIIIRIKSGRYLIIEPGRKNAQISNWPIIARELNNSTNYYLSHYSAMRLHGMTTHASNIIYITSPIRKATKELGFLTYQAIFSNQKHFWGFEPHWVNKEEKVNVSNIERTILDCLDRPEFCGGIKEIYRGIWTKQKDIDWEKLIDYALKYRTAAAAKRLGFLLELLDIKNSSIDHLYSTLSTAKDYILLDPHGPKEGKHLSRWHVQINLNTDEIKESVFR